MRDQDKTKSQLIDELKELRRSFAELEVVQKSITENESQYRQIIDRSNEAIFVLQDGRVQFANEKSSEIVGYSIEDILFSDAIATFVYPDDREMVLQHHARRLQGDEELYQYDFRIVNKDGKIRWLNVNPSLIMWEGKPAVLCLTTDITERKHAEEALRESEDSHRCLIDHLPQRIYIKDLNSVYLSCNRNYASDHGITPEQIVGKNDFDFYSPELAQAYRANDEACITTGATLDKEILYQSHGQELWAHSVKVPYYNRQGQVIGVLGIFDDITRRKVTEETLRSSEERFRGMFEKHSAVMLLIEPKTGRILDANKAAERFYGYTKSQLVSMSIQDINVLPPDDVEAQRNLALKEKRNYFVFPHRLADGEVRTVEVHSSPIEQNGALILFSIIHDITERKLAEELLESANEYNRTLIEASVDPFIIIATDGKISDVNAATEKITGYSRHELIGTQFSFYLTEPDKAMAGYQQVFKDGLVKDYELQVQHKDGHVTPVTCSASVYRDRSGEVVGVFAAARDITERKRLENERFEMDQKFRLAFENANIGVCLVDLQGKILRVNNKICEIFGYEKPELEGMTVNSIAHPDDRNVSPNFISHALEGEYKRLEFEKRYYHKFGHVIFGKVSSSLASDAQGKPLYFISHIQDVSESKRLEKEKESLIIELQQALSQVKKLSGFLPICSSCKKIRDDAGYWNEVESYISEHSDTKFSHGICPDCMRKLYPEVAEKILGRLEKDQEK
jgi:PAS domain S-box-containing protein